MMIRCETQGLRSGGALPNVGRYAGRLSLNRGRNSPDRSQFLTPVGGRDERT